MRNLLVTGGAGFIGGNFVHFWTREHAMDRVIVLDALTYAGNRATIASLVDNERITFVHGDITNAVLVDALFEKHGIDTVVHFAAESHVDRSIVEPGAFVRTNVVGTQVLLDASRKSWYVHGRWREHCRFHHVSTDEVYGSLGPTDPPFTESTRYAPNSPYAASKAASDHLVRAYAHTYRLPITISNCSNNYGPFQFPEKLIALMMVNALQGIALPIYGDGCQIRDWLHVDDHCRAIELILAADVEGQTFNVGGRAEHKNIEIVQLLCALLDDRFARDASLGPRFPSCPASRNIRCDSLISFVEDRAGHDRRYAVDTTQIAKVLAFEPTQTLASGLAQIVDWYLANEHWWRAVMDGTYRAWIDRRYGNAD